MAYAIKYLKAGELNAVREAWLALQTGAEMTVYQSFAWYQMLLEHYVPADTVNFVSLIAVVERDGHPCMIAPLWLVKHTFRLLNKQGFYLLGRDSFSDYLNFVYDDFDPKAFDRLVDDLRRTYRVDRFMFEHLRDSTSLYRHVKTAYAMEADAVEVCVALALPPTMDDYRQMLSKNARQNLRTASNRLARDGKSLTFVFDDGLTDRRQCMAIRESKLSVQYAKVSWLRKYKYRMVNRLLFHFPRFAPLLYFPEGKVMTACDDNGKLRAFFHYAYDRGGTCIRIMSAGTDLDYARYSPGMLLMHNFIVAAIKEGQVHEIDFTRGDEKYKFALGGTCQNNHAIKFHRP